jgi:glycosyltransferase involved in cell wall biosynthesis
MPPHRILEHMLAARLVRIANADRVVALKFPAYYVEHDRKVLWLLHQFRQAYDLYGSAYHLLPDTPEGRAIREMVQTWDDLHLCRARAIYTNSEVTSERLLRFNGIESEVLYPPLWDSEGYRSDDYGDYIFAAGRVGGSKRQDLLIEAMAHVQTDVRLVVAGPPESDDDLRRLQELADRPETRGRVTLLARWISDREKQDLFAGALACAYVPYDEDSYGYVTLESCQSRKTTVTCDDSGGVLRLVIDGETGHVTPPNPRALADAFDRLRSDICRARELGENAYALMKSLNISWDHVVETLLS